MPGLKKNVKSHPDLTVAEMITLFVEKRDIDFSAFANGQTPHDLAIRCFDSRIPAPSELNGIVWSTNAGGVIYTETQASILIALKEMKSLRRVSYFAHTGCLMIQKAMSDEVFKGPEKEVIDYLRSMLDMRSEENAMMSLLNNSVATLVNLRREAERFDVGIYGYVYRTDAGQIDQISYFPPVASLIRN
jgi:carbonic anhydrase